MEERTVILDGSLSGLDIYGENDALLRVLERRFASRITARGHQLFLSGRPEDLDKVDRVIGEMTALVTSGHVLRVPDVEQIIRMVDEASPVSPSEALRYSVKVSPQKAHVRAQTAAQRLYMQAIRDHPIVFGIGPAGTGKTYVAMAMAVSALEEGRVKRIILTRPVVEAGESLGYLPGDMQEKLAPYIRPLTDALHDMMDFEKIQRLMGYGVIELAPLAYMRGRTLNHCFVLLDEAQNTTTGQMKMFLTRLGNNSQAVVTGDITQIDLASRKMSGLVQAREILADIPGIALVEFNSRDVVRHPLVQKIIDAYERQENGARAPQPPLDRTSETPLNKVSASETALDKGGKGDSAGEKGSN
ncbi:PhoH family protein [bacterium]|nr:PhoH family protein [bacterium]